MPRVVSATAWVLLIISGTMFVVAGLVAIIHQQGGYEARRLLCEGKYDAELIYTRGEYRCYRKNSEILL